MCLARQAGKRVHALRVYMQVVHVHACVCAVCCLRRRFRQSLPRRPLPQNKSSPRHEGVLQQFRCRRALLRVKGEALVQEAQRCLVDALGAGRPLLARRDGHHGRPLVVERWPRVLACACVCGGAHVLRGWCVRRARAGRMRAHAWARVTGACRELALAHTLFSGEACGPGISRHATHAMRAQCTRAAGRSNSRRHGRTCPMAQAPNRTCTHKHAPVSISMTVQPSDQMSALRP